MVLCGLHDPCGDAMINKWIALDSRVRTEYLGLIPEMLSESDPRPAREQLNTGYSHGGGWHPFNGFKLNTTTLELYYPGDPPTQPLAYANLRDERIVVYEHSWVAIIQKDNSFEVCRMD